MGMLLLLAVAGIAVALAASQKPKATATVPATPITTEQTAQIAAYAQIPPAMVPTFVAAIRSGDPRIASSTADWFRAQGYSRAADVLTQAANLVPKPPAVPPGASAAAPSATTVPPTTGTSTATPVPPVPPAATAPPVGPAVSAPVPAAPATPAVPPFVPSPITVPTVPVEIPGSTAAPANDTLPVPAAILIPTASAPAPGTAAGPSEQDPPLPPNIRTLLESVLRTAHDPAIIYQAADMLQTAGFPNTAAELRKRAVSIASSQVDPIAIIQDILQHADQAKPPGTGQASPGATPGTVPQAPSTAPPASPGTAPAAPSPWPVPDASSPAVPPAAAPAPQVPGISVTIPTQITVPPIPGITTAPVAIPTVPPAAPGTRYYVVETGDNPSKIAKKFTGDANRWREMSAVNPEANLAAGRIYPGQRLKIPTNWPNAAAAGPVISVPMPGAPSVPIPGVAPASPLSPSGSSSAGTGYNPNVARTLALQVLSDVATNGAKYSRDQLVQFQRAAGLPPDGDYGPRSAGAVEYFANASAPPSLPKYGTGKKAYAPPRGTAL